MVNDGPGGTCDTGSACRMPSTASPRISRVLGSPNPYITVSLRSARLPFLHGLPVSATPIAPVSLTAHCHTPIDADRKRPHSPCDRTAHQISSAEPVSSSDWRGARAVVPCLMLLHRPHTNKSVRPSVRFFLQVRKIIRTHDPCTHCNCWRAFVSDLDQ